MELVRMKLADLRPNPMNPRRDFGDLDAFADKFDLNPVNPGEPVTPIIALRDANVARIVDGERRYRAMTKRGKVDECWVYLCDDMEEADVIVMMLSVDDRQSYSDEETCAGYQQALLLGVPEKTVDRMAGRKVSGALKRATRRNGGKAVQLSADRLLAADEFADSEEDYKAVIEARDWGYAARSIRSRREGERKAAELEEALAGVEGLVVLDSKPKGAQLFKSLYGLDAGRVRMEGPTWAAARHVLVRPRGDYHPWELYSQPRELSEEESELVKTKNRIRRIRSAGEKRRAEWLGAKLVQGGGKIAIGLAPVEAHVARYYREWRLGEVADFLKKAGVESEEWPVTANAWMLAAAWPYIDHLTNDVCDDVAIGEKADNRKRAIESHLELVRAMKASGYEPSEDEEVFRCLCEKHLAELHAAKKAKKGGDGK